jgi:hypothetical protein
LDEEIAQQSSPSAVVTVHESPSGLVYSSYVIEQLPAESFAAVWSVREEELAGLPPQARTSERHVSQAGAVVFPDAGACIVRSDSCGEPLQT